MMVIILKLKHICTMSSAAIVTIISYMLQSLYISTIQLNENHLQGNCNNCVYYHYIVRLAMFIIIS